MFSIHSSQVTTELYLKDVSTIKMLHSVYCQSCLKAIIQISEINKLLIYIIRCCLNIRMHMMFLHAWYQFWLYYGLWSGEASFCVRYCRNHECCSKTAMWDLLDPGGWARTVLHKHRMPIPVSPVERSWDESVDMRISWWLIFFQWADQWARSLELIW